MSRVFTLLVALSALAAAAPAGALGTEGEVLALFAGLPGRFLVESSEEVGEERIFRLRSAEPIERGAAGALYRRAVVTVSIWPDAAAAAAELEQRLAAADPDVGLSYAWDLMTAGNGRLIHLHAACTFSEEQFRELVVAVARAVSTGGPAARASFWCRCGAGCRPGTPDPAEQVNVPRVPPVRRPAEAEGEGEEYDNRLDPSGAWTSPIGELSLMHYASGLSFTYSAVFGPTAHLCEGAGVAGLVGLDRYEYTDEQGTVAFVIAEDGVVMELVDGIASFCGAGWAVDRFALDSFEPPAACTVTAERSHFHVTQAFAPERRRAYVVRGDRIEAAPVRLATEEEWVLGRFVGPLSTTVGLLARGDLVCPAAGWP